ncbi:MAG: hypothetical protein ACSHYB_03075 [Roseibacillus sp.]
MRKNLRPVLIFFPLFAHLLHGEPSPSDSFENIATEIRAEGTEETFDRQAAALKLLQIATVQQLASCLGEESIALQVCAVRALGLKKDKALLLYIGARNPEVRLEAAKFVLGPPTMPEGIPLLAKSLEYSPKNEELISRAITANSLLGDSHSANRLIRYASHTFAQLPMREKALAELLKFPKLTAANKKLIHLLLRSAFDRGTAEQPLSAAWLSSTLALCKIAEVPISKKNLSKVLNDLTQPQSVRLLALDAMLENGSMTRELLMAPDTNGLRLLVFARWYQKAPAEVLAFCRETLSANLDLDVFYNQRLTSRDQEILQFLTSLATPAADALLGESITGLILKERLDLALWLEVEEALAARGEAIKPQAHQLFEKLVADANKRSTLPEDRYPTLLEGGNRIKGYQIATSKRGRCSECHITNEIWRPRFSSVDQGVFRFTNLRSLIAPDHNIALGKGWLEFELKDGTTLSGPEISRPSVDTHLYLMVDLKPKAVDKKEISSMTLTSPMPSALGYLSHREIRDLVAYLSEN